jgi:uncharacterized protein (TIGR02145 family)
MFYKFSLKSNLSAIKIFLYALILISCSKSELYDELVYDADGNIYHTVHIGDQVWMVENLKTMHYQNGDIIPLIKNAQEWSQTLEGGYCFYGNKDTIISTYGFLYNGYAIVDTRNICPEGWHIPSDSEWQKMIDYLGGDSIAGGKMKEESNNHWPKPNTGASNQSGLTLLPGGFRTYCCGAWELMGAYGYWWTSSINSDGNMWFRDASYNTTITRKIKGSKNHGFSVRCIKDQ